MEWPLHCYQQQICIHPFTDAQSCFQVKNNIFVSFNILWIPKRFHILLDYKNFIFLILPPDNNCMIYSFIDLIIDRLGLVQTSNFSLA